MNLGDIVFYNGDGGDNVDYAVVTNITDYRYWAYWVKEKQVLTFSPIQKYYIKVGPSVLGKWQ